MKRVFILDDAEELVPRWLRFLRGVVDSEDLPLNVSRETLQDSRVVAFLRKQVVKQALSLLEEVAEERPEDYQTFWRSFGAVLKEGLHLDPTQKDTLVPLLRFETSAGEGLASFEEIKGRMKDGQKAIYFIVGDNRAQVEASPHLEGLKSRGYEVLYLTDPVDPFAIPSLGSVDDIPLQSITEADLDLGEDDDDDAKDERDSALKDLRDRVRVRLQEHVSEVRLSRRLVDSPVCLVVPPGGLAPHLERMLRAAQQDVPEQKRIVELNPDHAVIDNLRKLLEADRGEEVDEWIDLLFDQARVAEGSPLEDPAAFNRRFTKLLLEASQRLVDDAPEASA